MKKLLLLLLVSATMTAQNWDIHCGTETSVVRKDTDTSIDSLRFFSTTLLMQDNAILRIRETAQFDSCATILYGDVGDIDPAIPKFMMTPLPRTGFDHNGDPVSWNDYRFVEDVNPRIIFEKCMPEGITFGPYIDVEFTEMCSDEPLAVAEVVPTEQDLKQMNVIVYNMTGKRLFKGLYKDMFNYDTIDVRYANIALLLNFETEHGVYRTKRIFVD